MRAAPGTSGASQGQRGARGGRAGRPQAVEPAGPAGGRRFGGPGPPRARGAAVGPPGRLDAAQAVPEHGLRAGLAEPAQEQLVHLHLQHRLQRFAGRHVRGPGPPPAEPPSASGRGRRRPRRARAVRGAAPRSRVQAAPGRRGPGSGEEERRPRLRGCAHSQGPADAGEADRRSTQLQNRRAGRAPKHGRLRGASPRRVTPSRRPTSARTPPAFGGGELPGLRSEILGGAGGRFGTRGEGGDGGRQPPHASCSAFRLFRGAAHARDATVGAWGVRACAVLARRGGWGGGRSVEHAQCAPIKGARGAGMGVEHAQSSHAEHGGARPLQGAGRERESGTADFR